MDVGIQLIFASSGFDCDDIETFQQELKMGQLADEIGFDVIWPPEHHFFDYSWCPDNIQLLSYLAGTTNRIHLGTAAVIMPWHEPLRVAEKISMLEHLAPGRVRFGMGRGLSRREYAGFQGIEMDESRGRFDEGSAMVLEALRTGFIEGDGEYYKQPRVEIRPRPRSDMEGRIYAVASSDDSVESAARLGARMVMFADRSWKSRMPSITRWRELFREYHGVDAPPPLTADFCYCHPDADIAEERATKYLSTYLGSVLEHYEVMGDHFANTSGYDAYAKAAETLRKVGDAGFLKGFMEAATYGTPSQIIDHFRARRELMGDFELATNFRFGGIAFDEALDSMQLFATEVMPELKTW
ncbi:MAG: alkanesulfonate monooxygenase SsuD [Candidatus Poriferisodalaceae bacterium]|jgi:alkanesulfonate monooxygenase SsuD/methylene tetrahydromethanopterin reductase-like flavin-dependent oxidoreductase (luciferase family)